MVSCESSLTRIETCELVFLHELAATMHSVLPEILAGVVADVDRGSRASDKIDQIFGTCVVHVVGWRVLWEGHEVAGARLELLVADVGDRGAGQDVDELLIFFMEVVLR